MKLSQRYFELKESGLLLLKKLNNVGALREETHFGREYNDSYKDLVNLVVDIINIVNTILKNLRNGTTAAEQLVGFIKSNSFKTPEQAQAILEKYLNTLTEVETILKKYEQDPNWVYRKYIDSNEELKNAYSYFIKKLSVTVRDTMMGLKQLKNQRFITTEENLKKYFSVNTNPKAFDSPYFQKLKEEEE